MRTALTLLFLLLLAPAANAASVAYIADGEVWLASLDGTQRAKLAGHYTNSSGAVEKWNAVAQADNGRIVASRNEPGKISSLSWYQVWEPNGTSTIQSPLTMKGSWQLPVYPLSLDVSADGGFMVYGYSHSSCCIGGQYSFARGTYARPTAAGAVEPIDISGMEAPTLFASRLIVRSGGVVNVQAGVYSEDFTPWLNTGPTGYELQRTDVSADGRMMALELEQWTNGTQTTGKIGLISTSGVDQPPTFAVDCYVPATGVAKDVSLSQDASRVAWSDDDGLKVAGTPTTGVDPCVLSAAPVLIAPKGATSASIGPANVSAFLPPPPPTGGGTGTPVVQPPTPTPAAPTATVPARVTRAALTKGLAIKVKAAAAGKVTLSASVPAKALGRKGKAVVIATGSATARAAGTVTVKLKFNATGRKQSKRLKGKKATLRIAQGTGSTTKTITLR